MCFVAQGFSPFQFVSIQRDFDLKHIRLFSISISITLLFTFSITFCVLVVIKKSLVQIKLLTY